MKRTNYRVTREEFVDAWQGSNSTQEVADKLTALAHQRGVDTSVKMAKTVVQARASAYRKLKVNLKNMSRGGGGNKINVEKLNERINAQAN